MNKIKNNRIVAIVQARLTSKRFPGKVLKKIGKHTVLSCIYERLKKSKLVDEIVFTIPSNKKNKQLAKYLEKIKVKVIKGSEENVLSRYFESAKKTNATIIIRITGDCPLIDPKMIDKMILHYLKKPKVEYLTNTQPPTFPDGFDIEIFSFNALKKSMNSSISNFEKEHVTPYIKSSKIIIKDNYMNKINYGFVKLSIDTPQDLKKIKKIFKYFKNNIFFTFKDLLKKPFIKKILLKELGREIKFKDKVKKGQDIWKKAKNVISGGNMLLSKNPDRFLPGAWPTYYKKAKGCTITDLDGNKLTDVSLMGVGTNTLGYSNKEIDSAVKKAVNEGNMSTLNSVEEVKLAEKLIEIHPWFHMAKFTRTGGEANAVAIRIARAASGKDNVAICGYHGWHDWYLSANLNSRDNKNLDSHLLKGLKIKGVPKVLKKTTFPFNYGDYRQFKKIIKRNNIGVIKMEVCRNTKPDIKFLKYIRSIAYKKKIILIFDECTTGFRQSYGGLHKSIKVFPDMVIFGKAIGNGYAIAAILGKKNIMSHASNTFISSTFWTERIGATAALKTIQVMKKKRSWEKITKIGKKIQKRWKILFKKHKISVEVKGIPTLASFVFKNNHQKYKTLITQEMLKNNILASNVIYSCTEHTDKILNNYFFHLENVVKKIKNCENGTSIEKYLQVKNSTTDFKRLN